MNLLPDPITEHAELLWVRYLAPRMKAGVVEILLRRGEYQQFEPGTAWVSGGGVGLMVEGRVEIIKEGWKIGEMVGATPLGINSAFFSPQNLHNYIFSEKSVIYYFNRQETQKLMNSLRPHGEAFRKILADQLTTRWTTGLGTVLGVLQEPQQLTFQSLLAVSALLDGHNRPDPPDILEKS